MANKRWHGGAGDGNWATTANWYAAGVPVGGTDTVHIHGENSITTGLDQSGASGTFSAITIYDTFSGEIGQGLSYLQVKATELDINRSNGGTASSQLIKVDTGAVDSTITVHSTAAVRSDGMAPVHIKANDADTNVYIKRGVVDIGMAEDGESVALGTVSVGTVAGSSAVVRIGPGGVLYRLEVYGGTVLFRGRTTGILSGVFVYGGTLNIDTSYDVVLETHGGTTNLLRCGSGTTVMANYGSTIDFTQSNRLKTIASFTATPDADGSPINVITGNGRVVFTTGIEKGLRGSIAALPV